MVSSLPIAGRWAVGALLAAVGCASVGSHPYVWVDDLPPATRSDQPPVEGYVIRPGDLLAVRVWGQDGMSSHARVRDDGRISLLFLNDVDAAGLTPAVLSAQLQTRLKDYLAHPVVSVAIEETKPLDVSVLGEVAHPGAYPLVPGAGLLQALAAAGGLTDYANPDRVFLVRHGPGPGRIRFHYQDLTHSEGRGASFPLRPGDVVVVE